MAWTGAIVAWPRFDASVPGQRPRPRLLSVSGLPVWLVSSTSSTRIGTVTAIGGTTTCTGATACCRGYERILAIDAITAMIGGAGGGKLRDVLHQVAASVAESGAAGLPLVFMGLLFLASMALAAIAAAVQAVAAARRR